MRRWLRWMGWSVLGLALAAGGLYAWAWQRTEAGLAQRYAVADAPLARPTDPAALAHGGHLFRTRGCTDCHGEDGAGRLVMDAGPVVRLVAPNLTPAALRARGYDADRLAAAIRHGVRPDGAPLLFMPSGDWAELSDADTAALVAFLGTLPDAAAAQPPSEILPLGRVLYALGRFPLLPAERIDHAPRARGAPPAAGNADYGRYVAQVCTGCHGADFAGRPPLVAGTPPVADLTPAGLRGWSRDDFLRVMREGRRPDGRSLHPIMPWATFARMTDTELTAMWEFLRALPPAVPD